MLTEYLITFLKGDKSKTFRIGYRDGILCQFTTPEGEEMTEQLMAWLLNWLRWQLKEDTLHVNVGDQNNVTKFTMRKVEQDLSFENFWEQYAYKVGNKARAQKLWNNMSKEQKVACHIGVKAYNYWISLQPNTAKLYPETFLHQRRWENEYKY